jgi:hypothetical protein
VFLGLMVSDTSILPRPDEPVKRFLLHSNAEYLPRTNVCYAVSRVQPTRRTRGHFSRWSAVYSFQLGNVRANPPACG